MPVKRNFIANNANLRIHRIAFARINPRIWHMRGHLGGKIGLVHREHLMLIDPARDITVVERNFSGNSYLSTGLWMMMSDEDNRSSSFKGAMRARDVLAEMLDAN